MSQAEAEEHLFAILIMAANIAERLRKLSDARIEAEDSERVELLSEAIRQLSTQRIADGINRLLESDTASLDEATVAHFMKLFKGARIPTQGCTYPSGTVARGAAPGRVEEAGSAGRGQTSYLGYAARSRSSRNWASRAATRFSRFWLVSRWLTNSVASESPRLSSSIWRSWRRALMSERATFRSAMA